MDVNIFVCCVRVCLCAYVCLCVFSCALELTGLNFERVEPAPPRV